LVSDGRLRGASDIEVRGYDVVSGGIS
jgi:hypothetical protein